jgi:hypothetical protein
MTDDLSAGQLLGARQKPGGIVLDGTRTVRRVVTERTSLDEHMLHDVGQSRGGIEEGMHGLAR